MIKSINFVKWSQKKELIFEIGAWGEKENICFKIALNMTGQFSHEFRIYLTREIFWLIISLNTVTSFWKKLLNFNFIYSRKILQANKISFWENIKSKNLLIRAYGRRRLANIGEKLLNYKSTHTRVLIIFKWDKTQSLSLSLWGRH